MISLGKTTVFIIIISLLVFSVLVQADSWHIRTVDEDGRVGKDCSLTLDSDDNPHISYFDDDNNCVKYAYWTGSTWNISEVDDTIHVGYATSIDVDSIGNPHITYSDYTDNHNLKHAYWDGTSWVIQYVDTVGDNMYSSMDLDSDDNPHISYFDNDNHCVKYAHWTGSNWEITVIGPACGGASNTSISLDSYDFPHIAYRGTDGSLMYVNGFPWEIQDLDDHISYASITVDSNDNPHISYHCGVDTIGLKYAYWNGSDWEKTVVDSTWLAGHFTSIALDSEDNPHISHNNCDLLNLGHIKHSYYDGSTWNTEELDDTGAYRDTSIYIDSEDNPHIAYHDIVYDDVYKKLKYAWYGRPDQDLIPKTFSAVNNNESTLTLNWSVETTESEIIDGFNLYRREIVLTEKTLTTVRTDYHPSVEMDIWTKINEHLITGQDPYTYIDDTVEKGITYEYRLEAVLEDSTQTLGTTTSATGLPSSFSITSIHPNPAVDNINITLSTPETAKVKLEIYDLTGRMVKSHNVGEVKTDEHTEVLSISDLSSGVYTVKVSIGVETSMKRMVVIR